MRKIFTLLIIFDFILFSFLMSNSIHADSYLTDKTETTYNSKNGLLTGTANTVIQSDNGYIWIGQYAGLTRYDGKNFTTFTKYNDYDITGVMALDSIDNEVYIGTQKGLFYYKNKAFEKIDFAGTSFCVYAIDIYENYVYVATDTGLLLYNRSTKEITSLDNKNTIDVNVDKNLCYYLTDAGVVYKVGIKNSPYYDKTPIRSIFLLNNVLYLGENDGEIVIRNNTSETTINVNDRSINDMVMRDDILYIATDDGLYLMDSNHNVTSAGKLKNNTSIQDITFDYEGNLWVASSKTGVSKITTNDLKDYLYDYNLNSLSVNAIEKYQGYIFVATDNAGLYILDEDNKTVINNHLTEMLSGVRIRDLAIYNDKLYIGTYDTNDYDLVCYDGTNITNIDALFLADGESTTKTGQIRCLDVVDDSLLVGTNNGITKYNSHK